MALSNIFREPRREITESAVGLTIVGGVAYADYRFGVWFEHATTGLGSLACPCALGMLIGPLGAVLAALMSFLILVATHELGDAICNILARRGLELRPKQRRGQS